MKSNIVSVTTSPVSATLAALPTAKIVRHPKAKQIKEEFSPERPDEDTLRRLNEMAKEHPFCVLHRGNNHSWRL